jgi:AhpD family alkylhydroperoxidase
MIVTPARKVSGTRDDPSKRKLTMKSRMDYASIAPEGAKAMSALENYIKRSGLEPALLDLVKTRASQINGCAYCLDMHTKEARARGETEQRLYALAAWRETPFFTARERAALAWTEAVTCVAETHIPDEGYAPAREHFTEKELADLTLAIISINGWNRLAVAFRKAPGTYQPESK